MWAFLILRGRFTERVGVIKGRGSGRDLDDYAHGESPRKRWWFSQGLLYVPSNQQPHELLRMLLRLVPGPRTGCSETREEILTVSDVPGGGPIKTIDYTTSRVERRITVNGIPFNACNNSLDKTHEGISGFVCYAAVRSRDHCTRWRIYTLPIRCCTGNSLSDFTVVVCSIHTLAVNKAKLG